MANIHELGLGMLRLLTSQVEKDNNIEVWGDLEPHAKTMLGDLFPNSEIQIHPLVQTGYKIFESIQTKRQNSLIEQAKIQQQKLLENPIKEKVEEVKPTNDFRRRGYNNIR